ncbi:hypothetical protein Drorol1_Dr00026140 [Drosera rotundifolia]
MSSVCISSCVNDTIVPYRVRATYVNLHRWPESEAEFVRSMNSSSIGQTRQPKVVDSISCREVYLRSYKFTREESIQEKTVKCLGSVKEKIEDRKKKKRTTTMKKMKAKTVSESVMRRVKEVPCTTLRVLLKKLLFCGASVDVVDGE